MGLEEMKTKEGYCKHCEKFAKVHYMEGFNYQSCYSCLFKTIKEENVKMIKLMSKPPIWETKEWDEDKS